MTTTELDPLIKAFAKTLEEANIITATANTSDLTGMQFECFTPECQRVVMDSLDIEPGTVGGWEAMRVVGNGDRSELAWVGYDGRTYTHEEFDSWDYLMKNTAALHVSMLIQVVNACDLH